MLLRVDEETMEEFCSQRLVYLGSVVAVATEVALDDLLKLLPLDVRAGEGAWVQEDLSKVRGEQISVPDAEVVELMTPQKEALGVEEAEEIVDASQRLGHPIVIGVFGLAREGGDGAGEALVEAALIAAKATVGGNPRERRIAIGNEAEEETIRKRCWHAEG